MNVALEMAELSTKEVNHFEARLIARALEQENGSVTRAARELGLTHQGLAKILEGRQSTLAGARRPKETVANPSCAGLPRKSLIASTAIADSKK